MEDCPANSKCIDGSCFCLPGYAFGPYRECYEGKLKNFFKVGDFLLIGRQYRCGYPTLAKLDFPSIISNFKV